MPGYPPGGVGFHSHRLGRNLLRFHRRPACVSLVGIRADGNLLGFVFIHTAVVHSGRGLAGDGSTAIFCRKEKKLEEKAMVE